ncbi:hypothetical protein [uncultured Martelella sp.]|nr:hypothetical protein [uncultured Martelella sp.]
MMHQTYRKGRTSDSNPREISGTAVAVYDLTSSRPGIKKRLPANRHGEV